MSVASFSKRTLRTRLILHLLLSTFLNVLKSRTTWHNNLMWGRLTEIPFHGICILFQLETNNQQKTYVIQLLASRHAEVYKMTETKWLIPSCPYSDSQFAYEKLEGTYLRQFVNDLLYCSFIFS